VRAVRRYLKEYNIPHHLSNQVWQVMRRNHLASGGLIRESEVEVFGLLPISLKQDIQFESIHYILRPHPLFRWLETNHELIFRKVCINATQIVSITPHSTLFWSTIEGVNKMLFLCSGKLEYHPADGQTIDIIPGAWACEEILWCRKALLAGPICAGSRGAVVALLDPVEFRDVVRANKECCAVVRGYALRFVESFNAASRFPEYDDLLFQDSNVLEELLQEAWHGPEHGFDRKVISFKDLVFLMKQSFERRIRVSAAHRKFSV